MCIRDRHPLVREVIIRHLPPLGPASKETGPISLSASDKIRRTTSYNDSNPTPYIFATHTSTQVMTNANETSASLFAWMPFYSELATKLPRLQEPVSYTHLSRTTFGSWPL